MRERWRAVARETVEIVARGSYVNGAGVEVSVGEQVGAAVAGTRLYLPEDELAEPAVTGGVPVVEVTNETSLSAARRLGEDVACLVFASARNPGGGFLNGAQAQEESIARASALYACQTAVP
ncbi:MAG TPA: TIGR02452 family protein, partial [Micromonosporaceae bacterium]|nr:TIGR02452 family protein [Micromonosporaceae bacterium]